MFPNNKYTGPAQYSISQNSISEKYIYFQFLRIIFLNLLKLNKIYFVIILSRIIWHQKEFMPGAMQINQKSLITIQIRIDLTLNISIN